MKKSKIIKLLVSALSLCLIIGAMVGITAMAEETEPANPEIVSYNVSYSDELYLFYAVKATLAEGETIYLQICDENGNALEDGTDMDIVNPDKPANLSKITDWEIKTIYDEDYYVFVTNGVSAKDINKVEYVKAVITGGEADRESDIVEYSVLNYLYQRLYKDNVVAATEGADLLRKDLYQSLVAYGAAAQELLFPEEGITEFDSIRDSKYYFIEGNSYILYEDFDVVYPRHDETITVDGKVFYGWNVFAYAADGSVISDGSAVYADAARVNIAGAKGVYAKPVFDAADAEVNVVAGEAGPEGIVDFNSEYSEIINVPAALPSSIESNINGDGYLSLNKTNTSTGHASTIWKTAADEEGGNVAELSLDMYSGLNADAATFEISIYNSGKSKVWWLVFQIKNGNYYITAYRSELQADGETKKNVGYNFTLNTGDDQLSLNEWVDLKLVWSNGAWGSTGDMLDNVGPNLFVYLNGKVAARIDKAYNTDAAAAPGTLNYAVLNLNQITTGSMLIDNVSNKVVKKDVPTEADYTLTFDQVVSSTYLETSLNYADIGTAVSYEDSFEGKTNVLKFHKPYGTNPADGKSVNMGIVMKPTETQDNANCVIVDLDLYAPNNGMELYLMNGSSSVYTKIILGSTVAVPKNQWVHVKIEYYPATDTETLKINVTVTDNAGKTYTCASTSTRETAPTVDALSAVKIALSSAASGDYYFDNVKVTKAYVAPAV
ncbi:MAG: hypothetical protein IJY69_03605 [Clostridia bacterium]|nr:hypothetical protein [Clostridia bacterium]